EEADRGGGERADEHDDLAEPDRVPAAPPAGEHDDAAADPEEERRHPRGAEEARVEQTPQSARRTRRPVLDGVLFVLGDARHGPGPFLVAQRSNASGCITITRERIRACPSPQSSVQMTG